MERIYKIRYHSLNTYEEVVKEAFYQFLIEPCENEIQRITEKKISVSSGKPFYSDNHFGFQKLNIRSAGNFRNFEIMLECTVEQRKIKDVPEYVHSFDEEINLEQSTEYFLTHHLFLQNTKLTVLKDKSNIPIRQKGVPTYSFLRFLMNHIFAIMTYEQDVTGVETTATQAMKMGKGVCQDFTHIFIGMARENGIACRYVSGYLNQDREFQGNAMMHAWAEAFIPGIGWLGFDAANNIEVRDDHIKVCHGIDYSDCSPIKGVLQTFGKNTTFHQVKVAEQQQQ